MPKRYSCPVELAVDVIGGRWRTVILARLKDGTHQVLISVAGIGSVAGVLGVPVGMLLHDYVVPVMGRAAGTTIPAADVMVYRPAILAPLLLGGLVIAVAGALLPAGWAAGSTAAAALRAE